MKQMEEHPGARYGALQPNKLELGFCLLGERIDRAAQIAAAGAIRGQRGARSIACQGYEVSSVVL
jgi:hypothetical protein